MADVIDFSAFGKNRQQFKLTDGNFYSMYDPLEIGAAKSARISKLGGNSQELDIENPDEADQIEANTREMVDLVMVELPPDLVSSMPFEVIAALAAFFAQSRMETSRPMDQLNLSLLQESNVSTEGNP